MIIIKTKEEIDLIYRGGKILNKILSKVIENTAEGVSIKDLDKMAERLILEQGGVPSFKGYRSHRNEDAFPSTMCISINDEVVHGDGTRDIILKNGDIVDFDIGMKYPKENGLYTDMAKTVGVGKISKEAQKLIQVTEESLFLGIKEIRAGNKIKDIERAIQDYVEKNNFSVVRSLTGHGVGKKVHEDPMIPNYVEDRFGNIELQEGMVIAIEPMVNAGGYEVETLDDGWTVVTSDGTLSAHFEHTVAVLKDGYKILTK